MADLSCDLCQNEQAIMMQTNLQTGETITVGRTCLLSFTLGSAIQLSDGADKGEQEAYADLVASLLAKLAPSMLQLAKSAVPRPPRRKAAGKAAVAASQDGGISGSDSAGALTASDLAQIEAADS